MNFTKAFQSSVTACSTLVEVELAARPVIEAMGFTVAVTAGSDQPKLAYVLSSASASKSKLSTAVTLEATELDSELAAELELDEASLEELSLEELSLDELSLEEASFEEASLEEASLEETALDEASELLAGAEELCSEDDDSTTITDEDSALAELSELTEASELAELSTELASSEELTELSAIEDSLLTTEEDSSALETLEASLLATLDSDELLV